MNRWITRGGTCALALLMLAACAWPADRNCLRDAVYEDAVLHAGSTDFVFVLAGGMSVTLRIANDAGSAVGADALLALQDDGPAEASPARLGLAHDLCQEDGAVRISLAPQPAGG